jgi:hypothetical protein
VKIGQETLLALADDFYRSNIIQEYYWFGADGPVPVSVKPIWEAAQNAAPAETELWTEFIGRLDLSAGRLSVPVAKGASCCRCSIGVVEVVFTLSNGRIEVTRTRFDREDRRAGQPCK